MTDDTTPPTVTPPPSAPSGLVARVIAILTKPAETWDAIEAERSDIKSIYMSYIVPLAAISPVAMAIGGIVFGRGVPGLLVVHTSLVMGIVGAIVSYVLALAMVYVTALIVDALAPSFDGQKNMLNAFKVTAYGMTAGWVGGIFQIVPALGILTLIAAIYGLYITYLGLPKLMKNPKEKTIVYMIVIAVISIVAAIVIGTVGSVITGGSALMGGGFGGSHITGNNSAVTGNFNINTPDGKASVNLGQLAAAAESAASQASAVQNGTAAPVKVADPAALLALMPQSFMGAARTDDSTNSGGMGGMNASTASARYEINGGSVTLEVSDTGGMAGFGGMVNAMGVNASSSSAGGYSKMSTEGNRMVTEEYSTDSKSGKYGVVVDGRFAVSVDGSNVDMATLKALAGSVDLGKAASLAK